MPNASYLYRLMCIISYRKERLPDKDTWVLKDFEHYMKIALLFRDYMTNPRIFIRAPSYDVQRHEIMVVMKLLEELRPVPSDPYKEYHSDITIHEREANKIRDLITALYYSIVELWLEVSIRVPDNVVVNPYGNDVIIPSNTFIQRLESLRDGMYRLRDLLGDVNDEATHDT